MSVMRGLLLCCAALATVPAGCQRKPQQPPPRVVIKPPLPEQVQAAESFRILTDTAFTPDPVLLDASIGHAEAAAAPMRATLSPDAAKALDQTLQEIHAARAAMDRSRIAFAAAEGYRILTQSLPRDYRIPREVYLIGYAALRAAADLKSVPVRWPDMAQAAGLAGHTWVALKPRVTEDALVRRTDESVTELAAATEAFDEVRARAATLAVLNRVGELETYFLITKSKRPDRPGQI